MPSAPPMPDPPLPVLDEGMAQPTPEPMSDVEQEIRSLRAAVMRAQQQGRALMLMGFVSGLVCGALVMVLYSGL